MIPSEELFAAMSSAVAAPREYRIRMSPGQRRQITQRRLNPEYQRRQAIVDAALRSGDPGPPLYSDDIKRLLRISP